MRVELSAKGEPITVFTEDELIHFFSEAEAKFFLNGFLSERGNVETLRRVLAEDCGHWGVGRLNDHEVIDEMARRLVRACVGLVTRDLPYTTGPGPEGDDASGEDPVYEDLAVEEGPEAEYEEAKPEPVVPPEFPRLAQKEADSVNAWTKFYQAVLDFLKHVREKLKDAAEVPKALVQAAQSSGESVVAAAAGAVATLIALFNGDPAKFGQTNLGEKLADEAKDQGKNIKDAADKLSDKLDDLLKPGDDDKADDELEEDSWVILKMVDDVTDEPIAGAKFKLKFADGKETEVFTDGEGRAVIKDMPDGPFDIVAVKDQEGYEVVDFTEEAAEEP